MGDLGDLVRQVIDDMQGAMNRESRRAAKSIARNPAGARELAGKLLAQFSETEAELFAAVRPRLVDFAKEEGLFKNGLVQLRASQVPDAVHRWVERLTNETAESPARIRLATTAIVFQEWLAPPSEVGSPEGVGDEIVEDVMPVDEPDPARTLAGRPAEAIGRISKPPVATWGFLSDWLAELAGHDADWGGWGEVVVFSEATAQLARDRTAQRYGRAQLRAALDGLETHSQELKYLEIAWKAWTVSVDNVRDVVGASALVNDLARLVGEHAVVRARPAASRSQERDIQREKDALGQQIDGVVGRLGPSFTLPASEPPTVLVVATQEPEEGEEREAPEQPEPVEAGPAPAEAPTLVRKPGPPPTVVAASGDELAAPRAAPPVADTHASGETPPVSGTAPASVDAAGLSAGIAAPAPKAPEWPAHLTTFSSFLERVWIAPDRARSEVPWASATFAKDLDAGFVSAAARTQPSFSHLWVYAAAAERVGVGSLPSPREVELLATVWALGSASPQLRDPTRARQLGHALEDLSLDSSPRWRVKVLLEAIRPSTEAPLRQGVIDDLVATLDLNSADLRDVLADLLRTGTVEDDPLQHVLPFVNAAQDESVEALHRRLGAKRAELHVYFKSVMHAGGGKIKQTHCREAWTRFVDAVVDRLKPMFPPEHGGATELRDEHGLKVFVDEIEDLHREIANDDGAALNDRARMDRLAERLAGHARQVQLAVADVRRARDRKSGRAPIRADAFRRLRELTLADACEEFLRRALIRAATPQRPTEDRDPLVLDLGDAARAPELLELLPPATSGSGVLAHPRELTDARAAAVYLLRESDAPTPASATSLAQEFRRHGRDHLIGRLGALLDPEELLEFRARQASRADEARKILLQLARAGTRLADLASPVARDVRRAGDEADKLLEGGVERWLAFRGWLGEALAAAHSEIELAASQLRTEAGGREPDVAEAIAKLLDAGKHAEALARLRGPSSPGAHGQRITCFRAEATTRFPTPRERLNADDLRADVEKWLEPAEDPNADRALRTEFARLAFGETLFARADRRSLDAIKLSCLDASRWLEEQQLNPSYVPQLHRYGHIVVPRILAKAREAAFADRAAEAAAAHASNLVILLAPGLPPERRLSVLEHLGRRKGSSGVLVDDLDLCRMLLSPEGNRPTSLLALLEVALEQQRWTAVSPFQLVEGQHTAIEMYQGRRDEARQLAHEATHSRLFSGRKLGKSALLRYVERSYGGKPLPSELILRVVYVSAVGIHEDQALVDEIVVCMGQALVEDIRVATRPGESAGDRLTRIMRAYLERHPKDSLLLVLDEADAFVERQLVEFDRNGGHCLSMVMRSRIQAERDSSGLPRVRFVFAGYRITHTREGAFRNWGEVLRLAPLAAGDAQELVVGALARLGLDAEDVGSVVAHRCGYQPAVLLRFGERLLARLEAMNPPSVRARTTVTVTLEDVAAVYEEQVIQDEIRTIAQNNFQGNEVAGFIFRLVVAEFMAAGATARLTGLGDALLRRIEGEYPTFLVWLTVNGSPRAVVESRLKDLVERQLLEQGASTGSPSYGLRFPHHLSALASLAYPDALADEARKFDPQNATAPVQRVLGDGLLSRDDLDRADELAAEPDPAMTIVPVLAAQWHPAARVDRMVRREILDRLDVRPDDVFIGKPPPGARPPTSWAITRVSGEELVSIAEAVGDARPLPYLIGGVDLLREARRVDSGSVDAPFAVQCLGVGRLRSANLDWWFDRRGFTFRNLDATSRILSSTSGIPLLVSLLDDILGSFGPAGAGLDVDDAMLERALHQLGEQTPDVARLLVEGPPEVRLEPREREVVQMVAHIATTNGKAALDDLSEYWGDWRTQGATAAKVAAIAPLLEPETQRTDGVALWLLEAVGLVPVNKTAPPGIPFDRLDVVHADDAVAKIGLCLMEF